MKQAKSTEKTNKLFVGFIAVNNKQLKNTTEALIIEEIRNKFLHVILVDGVDVAIKECEKIAKEVTEGQPVKGNIFYSFIRTDDEQNIEFVRHSHGGGNNPSARSTGGVVVATIKTERIKGELSPIHGFTWYQEKNPFAHLID